MRVTVISLLALFFIFAFAGVQPITTYKDILIDKVKGYAINEVPQYIQSPIDTKMSVEADYRTRFGLAYWVTVEIIPTAAARLDTPYVVKVTSPYWDWEYNWDVLWSENPDLKSPAARGLHTIERSILIEHDNPLYEHIGQLEYCKFVQEWNAWTMIEIEAEYQSELGKLLNIRVIR